jgi:hypothetical protein
MQGEIAGQKTQCVLKTQGEIVLPKPDMLMQLKGYLHGENLILDIDVGSKKVDQTN